MALPITNAKLSENVNIVISIIIGLTISKILEKSGDIIRDGNFSKLSGYQWVWLAILLLAQVQYWWSIIKREVDNLSLLKFIIIIASPILMFLMFALLLPADITNSEDSMQYYYTVHFQFFLMGTGVVLANFLDQIIRHSGNKFKVFCQIFLCALMLGGIFLDDHLYHRIVACAVPVLIFLINIEF